MCHYLKSHENVLILILIQLNRRFDITSMFDDLVMAIVLLNSYGILL